MPTALDIITLAYQDLGVVGVGQALSAALSSLGLATFNVMLDELCGERSMLYSITRNVYPFVVGTYQYQIGPSASGPGAIVTDRPVVIQSWSVLLTVNGGNPPLELTHRGSLTADDYDRAIALKTLTSTFPTVMYYNAGTPNGTLNFWPVPQQQNSMVLYTPQNIDSVSSLTQVLAFPPGYQKFFEYCLAEDLSAKVGRDCPPMITKKAAQARAQIKAKNQYVPELSIPFNKYAGFYNWLTDSLT